MPEVRGRAACLFTRLLLPGSQGGCRLTFKPPFGGARSREGEREGGRAAVQAAEREHDISGASHAGRDGQGGLKYTPLVQIPVAGRPGNGKSPGGERREKPGDQGREERKGRVL